MTGFSQLPGFFCKFWVWSWCEAAYGVAGLKKVFLGAYWTPLTNPDSGQVMIRSGFGAISSLQLDTPTGRAQNDDFGRFSTFWGLVGDFSKGHMSQICLGCILEVF